MKTGGFGDPALLVSGLLSYNFLNTSTQSRFAYFALGGFGVTNTVPVSLNCSWGGKNDYASVLNLGAGIKSSLADPVAMRVEYRCQKYMGDIDRSNHMFLAVCRTDELSPWPTDYLHKPPRLGH